MKILFDTSVLVAGVVKSHPAHQRVTPWFQKIRTGIHTGLVSAHSLLKVYATLTTFPGQPRISPSVARQLIQHDILNMMKVVILAHDDYLDLLDHLSVLGIMGGAVYDAGIMQAAFKADVDQILTLNERDFRRVYPELADRVISP